MAGFTPRAHGEFTKNNMENFFIMKKAYWQIEKYKNFLGEPSIIIRLLWSIF